MSTATPAGGFRVDAPQPEKSRQEEAPFDVDSLPPTQYLILEAVAARLRLGERGWTLPSKVGVKHLDQLGAHGLIEWKHAVTAGSVLVWLTDEGKRACFDEAYDPPLVGEVRRLGEALQQAQRAEKPAQHWDEIVTFAVKRREWEAFYGGDLADASDPLMVEFLKDAFSRADAAEAELAELRERAQHEEQDAGAAETYAAEVNDGHLLALAQVRRWAWQDVLRLIKPKAEDIPHEH